MLTSMVLFDLGDNPWIVGTFPSELGKLNASLIELNIAGTSVTGRIPDELCSIEYLTFDCSEVLCGCSCLCEDT